MTAPHWLIRGLFTPRFYEFQMYVWYERLIAHRRPDVATLWRSFFEFDWWSLDLFIRDQRQQMANAVKASVLLHI